VLGVVIMSSNAKKTCGDVFVVWHADDLTFNITKGVLDRGRYCLLICLDNEVLMRALTSATAEDRISLVLPSYLAAELLPIIHDDQKTIGIDLVPMI
jgi:hypothetical protein